MGQKVVRLAALVGMSVAAAGCAAGGQSAASHPSQSRASSIAAQAHAAARASASAASASAAASVSAAASAAAAAKDGAFGSGCANLPDHGAGSLHAMASLPAGTAIASSPELTTFAHVVRASGLTRKLNSAPALTIFAPDNSAFANFGAGNVKTLLASKRDLARLVDDDVAAGRLTRTRLTSGKPLISLLGTRVYPATTQTGGDRVDNALVACGNIQTANATIYIVGDLLIR